MSHYNKHIFVCVNQKPGAKPCCANSGGESFFDYLKAQLKEQHLQADNNIRVSKSGCLGRCSLGPCLVIYPEDVWYTYATHADIDEIISQHIVSGRVVERLLINS